MTTKSTVLYLLGKELGIVMQTLTSTADDVGSANQKATSSKGIYMLGTSAGTHATLTCVDNALHGYIDDLIAKGLTEEADSFSKGMQEGIEMVVSLLGKESKGQPDLPSKQAVLTTEKLRESEKIEADIDQSEGAALATDISDMLKTLGFSDVSITITKKEV